MLQPIFVAAYYVESVPLRKLTGFTLIELVVVIIVLGIIALVAAPKFLSLSTDAKVSALESIAGQIESTNKLIQAKARVKGLSPVTNNPGGIQTDYIVEFEFGSVEVDFRSLCAEARGEAVDQLDLFDFMQIDTSNLSTAITNQYASVGYKLPTSGAPAQSGCYVYYDSFSPQCNVVVVDTDC